MPYFFARLSAILSGIQLEICARTDILFFCGFMLSPVVAGKLPLRWHESAFFQVLRKIYGMAVKFLCIAVTSKYFWQGHHRKRAAANDTANIAHASSTIAAPAGTFAHGCAEISRPPAQLT